MWSWTTCHIAPASVQVQSQPSCALGCPLGEPEVFRPALVTKQQPADCLHAELVIRTSLKSRQVDLAQSWVVPALQMVDTKRWREASSSISSAEEEQRARPWGWGTQWPRGCVHTQLPRAANRPSSLLPREEGPSLILTSCCIRDVELPTEFSVRVSFFVVVLFCFISFFFFKAVC